MGSSCPDCQAWEARYAELEKLLGEVVPFLRKVPRWLDQDSHETIGPDLVTPREQEKARSLIARIEKGRG